MNLFIIAFAAISPFVSLAFILTGYYLYRMIKVNECARTSGKGNGTGI